MEQTQNVKVRHVIADPQVRKRYIQYLVEQMGFKTLIRLKAITNHPIAKRENVLYVLPDGIKVYYDKKTKEYKKFDIPKWYENERKKDRRKFFLKHPILFIYRSIKSFFRKKFLKRS